MEHEATSYRQLLAYLDDLYRSAVLAAAIEKEMRNRGYNSLTKAGRQSNWQVTSAIDRPAGWRLKWITRFLVPKAEITNHSLMYQVLIDPESAFHFPTILCARVEHPPLSEEQIYYQVFRSDSYATVHTRQCDWKSLQEENGWIVGQPGDGSPTNRVRGYLLSLLEVNSVALVTAKIIQPLMHAVTTIGLWPSASLRSRH